MMIVYHHTTPGMSRKAFKGAYSECLEWIAANKGDGINYYMRVAK